MLRKPSGMKHSLISYGRVVGAFAFAICLSALPALAQQYPQQYPPDEPSEAEPLPPDPYYAEGAPSDQSPARDPQEADPYYAEAAPPPQTNPNRPVPPTLTLTPGTVITVRVSQEVSSDHSRPGDEFYAVLDQPVVVNGWVVARRGQTIMGRVAVAQKAGGGGGRSQLGLEMSRLILVDGQQVPLRTQLIQATGPRTNGHEAETIGITTILGTVIGGVAGGGKGAGIGAAAGAAAGIIGVLATPGRPTVIYPETQLTFRQEVPVNISTARSPQAFQPVSQQDYGTRALRTRPQSVVAPPPVYGPAPYYSGYYPNSYGWGGFYPAPVFGFGYYRSYVRPRVYVYRPRIGRFGGYYGGRGGFRGGFRGWR